MFFSSRATLASFTFPWRETKHVRLCRAAAAAAAAVDLDFSISARRSLKRVHFHAAERTYASIAQSVTLKHSTEREKVADGSLALSSPIDLKSGVSSARRAGPGKRQQITPSRRDRDAVSRH